MPNVGFINKLLELEETVAKKQPMKKKKSGKWFQYGFIIVNRVPPPFATS